MRLAVSSVVALALVGCIGGAAFAAAPRTEGFRPVDVSALKFTASPYVTITDGVLTSCVPAGFTNITALVEADIDLSEFNAKGFEFVVEGWGEQVTKPRISYHGVKFSVSFTDPVGGEKFFMDAKGVLGDYDRRVFSAVDSIPRQGRVKAKLRFGLQCSTGKACFDLNTLKVRPIDLGFKLVNQDFRVNYPDSVRRMPLLRGAMLPDRPERMDEGTFRDLAAWGGTVARYHMTGFGANYLDGGRPAEDVSFEEEFRQYDAWLEGWMVRLEKDVLGWARKHGIRLAVCLQCPPGGRFVQRRDRNPIGAYGDMRMFYYDEYAKKFVAVWKMIAKRLKGNEDVIYGYDLINEPDQKREALIDYWKLQKLAAEAVREIDANTTIIFEANTYDNPEAFAFLSPLRMDNVIYSVHMYRPHEFTHQGLYGIVAGNGYPNAEKGWDKEFMRKTLRPVREFQLRHGARIFVGEFSAAIWAEGADRYLSDNIDLFEEYGWDWAYHAFREAKCWSVEHECDKPMGEYRTSSDNSRLRVLKTKLKPIQNGKD